MNAGTKRGLCLVALWVRWLGALVGCAGWVGFGVQICMGLPLHTTQRGIVPDRWREKKKIN
jgi:hypothetical protein